MTAAVSDRIIDGKGQCPLCDGWFTVTKSGDLRSHKCSGAMVDGVQNIPSQARGGSAKKVPPKKTAPSNVRSLGSAIIAGGIEWGTTQYMASTIPCNKDQIPEVIRDVPDADKMVGPFIEILWPAIPKGAQAVITKIAEHEDIIAALMLWGDYFGAINGFTKTNHKLVMDQRRAVQAQSVQRGGVPNVATETPTPSNGRRTVTEPVATWPEPFQPVS